MRAVFEIRNCRGDLVDTVEVEVSDDYETY
jgi:hypothetical protein